MTHDPLDALDECQSVDDAVALLKRIGLDITYTDDGLRVIARQIIRMGQRDERRAGYVEGLDAAYAAIKGLEFFCSYPEQIVRPMALDAITALRPAAGREERRRV
jgi:hypothetical protein